MGDARWSSTDWSRYATTAATKSTAQLYTARSLDADFDARLFQKRESRDSTLNPLSTPIAVALDVTGSMGIIAEKMAKQGLGTLVEQVLERRPVTDPHLLFMGIGDAWSDIAPFQATQFEADIRIAEQLERIWLEGHGGGNHHESYHLAWWFAAHRTSTDAWEKRSEKGWLFTIGDEECPPALLPHHAKAVFGDTIPDEIKADELVGIARERWNVRHIVVEQGNYAKWNLDAVMRSWTPVLGQDLVLLSDYNHISEVIVSVIQVAQGADPQEVMHSWPAAAQPAVAHALGIDPPRTVVRF